MKVLWPLSLLFYVDKINSNDSGQVVHGAAYGFVIKIVNKYKDDRGLLAHELCHVKQFWLHGLLIHTYLRLIFKKYRMNCEAEAYAKQWVVSKKEVYSYNDYLYNEKLKENFITRIEFGYKLSYDRNTIERSFNKYAARLSRGGKNG